MPFADLMQKLVFDKLGMARSTFEQPLPNALAAYAATAHRSNGEPVPADGTPTPSWRRRVCGPRRPTWRALWSRFSESEAGESNVVLSFEMTRQMLTPPPGGWVALGPPS